MKKTFLLASFFMFLGQFAFAQMERTVYQSFEIDSAETISLDLVGDYEVRAWAGNSILTETNIQIWKASPKILDYFIENGRYEILADKSVAAANLYSKNKERKPLKTKEGDCTEIITVKIFIPDTFVWSPGEKKIFHKKPAHKEGSASNAPVPASN